MVRKQMPPLEVTILRPVNVNVPGKGSRVLYPDPEGERTETLPHSVARLLISQNQAALAPAAAAKEEAAAVTITDVEEAEALELIAAADDIEVLKRWVGQEEKGDAREAVVDALDERGAELYRRLKAGDTAAETGDPLEGVQFASPTAAEEAREADLRAAHFADVSPSGEGGYTAADVRAVIEKAGG